MAHRPGTLAGFFPIVFARKPTENGGPGGRTPPRGLATGIRRRRCIWGAVCTETPRGRALTVTPQSARWSQWKAAASRGLQIPGARQSPMCERSTNRSMLVIILVVQGNASRDGHVRTLLLSIASSRSRLIYKAPK